MKIAWFGSDRASQQSIALNFDRVSLRTLALSNRTRTALLNHNCKMTVGDVIRTGEHLASIKGLSVNSLVEIDTKIRQLLAETQVASQLLSPDQFEFGVFSSSAMPVHGWTRFLSQSVRTLPLDWLQLDKVTHHALLEARITTLGQLFEASGSYLSKIEWPCFDSLENVNDSYIALLQAIDNEGNVDWYSYWKERGIQLLPLQSTVNTPLEKVIEAVPTVIEEVLRRELNERAATIIRQRFGLGNVARLTLEDIGNAFGGLSKERIRQIEKKALQTLQDIFIEQHYMDKDYHIHPGIHLLLQTVRHAIEAQPSKLIRESKLLEYVGRTLNIDASMYRSSILFILFLIDATHIELDSKYTEPMWGYTRVLPCSILISGVRHLNALLTREILSPLTEFDLLAHLNQKAKKAERLTKTQLPWLIDLCNSIERREDGLVWAKFEYLKGRENQAERLLIESGQPMSVAALAREINHRLVPSGHRPVTGNNLSNKLSINDRLVPLGRTGHWGLKNWTHLDGESVTEFIEQYLTIENRPARVDEIYLYVRECRPVSRNAILSHLRSDREHFRRVSIDTWGLARWLDAESLNIWDPEQVADFVVGIFEQYKTRELNYKIIKDALMKKTAISPNLAQTLLNHTPAIKTRRGAKYRETIAILQPDYKAVLAQARTRKRRTQRTFRQQVEEIAHQLLEAAPGKQMLMMDLIRQLRKRIDCSDNTFYAVIGGSDMIEQCSIPGVQKKMCRVKERREGDGRIGTLQDKISESVRAMLENMPDKQMILADIIKQLQKQYNYPKATLYRYVSQLDYIECNNIPHSRYKLCRLKDAQD